MSSDAEGKSEGILGMVGAGGLDSTARREIESNSTLKVRSEYLVLTKSSIGQESRKNDAACYANVAPSSESPAHRTPKTEGHERLHQSRGIARRAASSRTRRVVRSCCIPHLGRSCL